MSTDQLFAYYKATAPIADTAFFVSACQRSGYRGIANQAIYLLAEAEQGLPRVEVYRRLRALQDSWRATGLYRDLAATAATAATEGAA
jgi:hypothetical protein